MTNHSFLKKLNNIIGGKVVNNAFEEYLENYEEKNGEIKPIPKE